MSISFKTRSLDLAMMRRMDEHSTTQLPADAGKANHPQAASSKPGPSGPRGIGFQQLRALRQDYLGTVQGWHRRWGDVVQQRLLLYRDFSFVHPEHVRELLVQSHEGLLRWPRATEIFASAHGQSVLVAEGPAWKRQRQMLQPGFAPKRVDALLPLMVSAGQQALQRWDGAGSEAFGFEAAMTQLTWR